MDYLVHLILFLESSKYILIFIGCFVEGTVVMMGAGLLWHVGQVEFWPAYIALLAADILADIMWYYVGFFGARRFMDRWGHFINMTPEVVMKIEKKFHKHHVGILLLSKLSMGFGFAVATLTTAGMLRVPFFRYLTINAIGGVIWVYGMMLVGYYFGNVLELIPRDLQILAVVLACVGVFFALRALTKKIASLPL
ncbi:MAG: hypothetical protein RIQ56_275 [Candidatus Parcubacteria bacterium]|jgi:membrane-associated protein